MNPCCSRLKRKLHLELKSLALCFNFNVFNQRKECIYIDGARLFDGNILRLAEVYTTRITWAVDDIDFVSDIFKSNILVLLQVIPYFFRPGSYLILAVNSSIHQ